MAKSVIQDPSANRAELGLLPRGSEYQGPNHERKRGGESERTPLLAATERCLRPEVTVICVRKDITASSDGKKEVIRSFSSENVRKDIAASSDGKYPVEFHVPRPGSERTALLAATERLALSV